MIILFFPLKCKVNPKERNLREVRIHRAMVLHVKRYAEELKSGTQVERREEPGRREREAT